MEKQWACVFGGHVGRAGPRDTSLLRLAADFGCIRPTAGGGPTGIFCSPDAIFAGVAVAAAGVLAGRSCRGGAVAGWTGVGCNASRLAQAVNIAISAVIRGSTDQRASLDA